MTEAVVSQVQASVITFLRRVHGVTLRDKVRSCKIHEALNVKPLLRKERSQLRWFGHVARMSQERLARHVLLATATGKRPQIEEGPGGVSTTPTLLGPVLVWSQQKPFAIAENREMLRVLLGLVPLRPSQEEKGL